MIFSFVSIGEKGVLRFSDPSLRTAADVGVRHAAERAGCSFRKYNAYFEEKCFLGRNIYRKTIKFICFSE
jgi:hypothetical protein